MRKLKPTEVKRQLEIADSLCKGWVRTKGFEEERRRRGWPPMPTRTK